MKSSYTATSRIANEDIVWKLGKLQRVYNELQCYDETASLYTNLLIFCLLLFQQYVWVIQQDDTIGWLPHYAKNLLSSSCTSLRKHEEKRRLWLSFHTMSWLTMCQDITQSLAANAGALHCPHPQMLGCWHIIYCFFQPLFFIHSDIKKARLLLKSVTTTNPHHGPGI
jgi:hypothetical protein